jgi:hypothetical protein
MKLIFFAFLILLLFFGCVEESSVVVVEAKNDPVLSCANCTYGENFSTKEDCLKYKSDCNVKSYRDYVCCNDINFVESCSALGGLEKRHGLMPVVPTISISECFLKVSDLDKPCSSADECSSRVCMLQQAIDSGVCVLTSKVYAENGKTAINGADPGVEYYTETYSCQTNKPGKCGEVTDSLPFRAGYILVYTVDGKTLIKESKVGEVL